LVSGWGLRRLWADALIRRRVRRVLCGAAPRTPTVRRPHPARFAAHLRSMVVQKIFIRPRYLTGSASFRRYESLSSRARRPGVRSASAHGPLDSSRRRFGRVDVPPGCAAGRCRPRAAATGRRSVGTSRPILPLPHRPASAADSLESYESPAHVGTDVPALTLRCHPKAKQPQPK
jgi:hypothetical protein